MASDEDRNAYLDQVVAQQEQLESDLRSKRSATATTGLLRSRLGGG
jgi:hypothetical protein